MEQNTDALRVSTLLFALLFCNQVCQWGVGGLVSQSAGARPTQEHVR